MASIVSGHVVSVSQEAEREECSGGSDYFCLHMQYEGAPAHEVALPALMVGLFIQ